MLATPQNLGSAVFGIFFSRPVDVFFRSVRRRSFISVGVQLQERSEKNTSEMLPFDLVEFAQAGDLL